MIGQKPGKDNIMYPNNIYIKHWRSVQTGVPDLLSVEDKRLLGL